MLMPVNDPGIFYLAMVLPGLFALTLIIEGVHKILRDEPGLVSLLFGTVFLSIVFLSYFFLDPSTSSGQAPKFAVRDRISVTMPVLTATKEVLFFLKGASKKTVWDTMTADTDDERKWPAKSVIEKTKTTVITRW